MLKTRDLTRGDIENIFPRYQVPRKQWKNVEWKKNWWQSVKWDPPSYEKWTDKDEKKLQDLKSAEISLDDTAYGRYKKNCKRDVLNSIDDTSEEELTAVQRKLDFCLQ